MWEHSFKHDMCLAAPESMVTLTFICPSLTLFSLSSNLDKSPNAIVTFHWLVKCFFNVFHLLFVSGVQVCVASFSKPRCNVFCFTTSPTRSVVFLATFLLPFASFLATALLP